MLLFAIGLGTGTLGTMIGAGGGFILVPILLFLFPEASHNRIAALSMISIALNATSGSIAYFFHKRVHLKAALVFIVASLPGAILGVQFEKFVTRSTFETIFGIAMLIYAALLFFKDSPVDDENSPHAQSPLSLNVYTKGAVISFFVGFLASFLSIGGGIIHVPLLSHVLGFPVHLAAGTSHFILACTAWAASYEHWKAGEFSFTEPPVVQLGIGIVLGAQLGAALSKRVHGHAILKTLAIALFLVGIRLLSRVI